MKSKEGFSHAYIRKHRVLFVICPAAAVISASLLSSFLQFLLSLNNSSGKCHDIMSSWERAGTREREKVIIIIFFKEETETFSSRLVFWLEFLGALMVKGFLARRYNMNQSFRSRICDVCSSIKRMRSWVCISHPGSWFYFHLSPFYQWLKLAKCAQNQHRCIYATKIRTARESHCSHL